MAFLVQRLKVHVINKPVWNSVKPNCSLWYWGKVINLKENHSSYKTNKQEDPEILSSKYWATSSTVCGSGFLSFFFL
jgi:hypothetical protein